MANTAASNLPDEAELKRLQNQVVAQAREIAVIRWEIASLMRQQVIAGHVAHAKYALMKRFPQALDRAARVARRVKRAVAKAGGQPTKALGPPRQVKVLGELEVMTPVLIADDGQIATRVASELPADGFVKVKNGSGIARSLPVALAGEPALRVPLPDSLAQYLVDNDGRLDKFGTVLVDAGDEVSLSLVRGRLSPQQKLLVVHSTSTEAPASSGLGAPAESAGKVSLYTKLPDDWLDPLTVASAKSQQAWPKISVVMVSFNQAQFLEEGLRSVLDQGYPNLEFIVIDGSSKDGSVDILERYRPRLSVLVIEPDKGQSDGLNKGFARATGEIVTWVNSDDLLEPGALYRVAQTFMAHKVDVVAGGCRQIGLARSEIILNHHNRLPYGLPVAMPLGLLLEMDRFWLSGCFFYQPEVFFTRDIWLRSGGRLRTDLNYILDYDLWVRMAAAGATVVHIPDFLACSRTHDQQKTVAGMPYMPEVQRLLQEYASRLIPPPN